MVFQPVKPARLADAIADQIRDLILEGTLPPGIRLPTERELAERFETSRPTIRDALAKLEQEGLVRVQRGGLHVIDPTEDAIKNPIMALFASNPDHWEDYLEFRLIVESAAAYYAALRATSVDRENINACFQRMVAAHDRADEQLEATADAEFHLAVYEACHNLTMLHVMRGLADLLRNDVLQNRSRLYLRTGYRDVTLKQHRAIHDAIMAGEPEAARAAAQSHITFARDALEELKKASTRLEISLRRIASRSILVDGTPERLCSPETSSSGR